MIWLSFGDHKISPGAKFIDMHLNGLNGLNYWNEPAPPSGAFFSTGKPAACQACHPPMRARAFDQPAFCKSRATRALVASSGHAQNANSHVSRGTASSLRL